MSLNIQNFIAGIQLGYIIQKRFIINHYFMEAMLLIVIRISDLPYEIIKHYGSFQIIVCILRMVLRTQHCPVLIGINDNLILNIG
jgi:hypothetical protein